MLRRSFLGIRTLGAQTSPSTSPQRTRAAVINHLTLNVSGLDESRSFYDRMVGVGLMQQGKTAYNLGPVGSGFIQLRDGSPRGIVSGIAFGVSGGVPEVSFQDPDGLRLLVVSDGFTGAEPVPDRFPTRRTPIFPAKRLSGIDVGVSDLDRSRAFYETQFGLSALRSDAETAVLAIGADQFLRLIRGRVKPGAADHVCFAVESYVPESAVSRLSFMMPENNPSDVTDDALSILDPDGITLVIAGLAYRG